LRFTNGHITNMVIPVDEPVFFSFSGCTETDGPQEVRLVSVAPVKVRGVDVEDVSFRAAWPAPTQTMEIGSGTLKVMGPAYGPVDSGRGKVQTCATTTMSTGLELAVVVPHPERSAAVVDGIRIAYEIGEKRFEETAKVTVGICAAHPAAPEAEPDDCKDMAKAIKNRNRKH
jgi:hypothetical protein